MAALGAGVALLYTARTYRLTRRGQVTDRFTKALERLGSSQIYVRIGGILALEQIVKDAPDQVATDAGRVLNHFLHDQAPKRTLSAVDLERAAKTGEALSDKPGADVQVALTALTRAESRTHVDPTAPPDLIGLHLAGAYLVEADLTGAFINRADLTHADLHLANLSGALLMDAVLIHAQLVGVALTNANLNSATLTRADLTGADLTGADLFDANLTAAVLARVDFTGADLTGANLTDAHLWGVDLSTAKGLTQDQLHSARTNERTLLPPNLCEPGTH
ncbi:pentapeptide repeat-containing protein [Streptomyces yangpuensis]|uniref:pentapeptide repeat-containing protein n=1 Tax=Streptomyces yangpuensis TaxID=1648182 RepID=UPI003662A5FE